MSDPASVDLRKPAAAPDDPVPSTSPSSSRRRLPDRRPAPAAAPRLGGRRRPHAGQTRKSGEPTSPIRWRWRRCWRSRAWTSRRWSRRSCTTPSRTRRCAWIHRQRVRRNRGRAGRGRHQAGQAALRRPPGGRGRELPQDAAGDGARPARDPDQARRPPAQHAHARRAIGGGAHAHRARDAGDLRAHRPAPGHEPDQGRTAGPRLGRCIPCATACWSGASAPSRWCGARRWRRSRRSSPSA